MITFEPNIIDKLLGGFSEDDIVALSKPAYPIKEFCGLFPSFKEYISESVSFLVTS